MSVCFFVLNMARPTTYTPEAIEILQKYIKEAVPENMSIPTFEGLALKLGITKKTIYNWADHYDEWKDALEDLKMIQKEALVKIGIFGGKEINSTIVSLLLKVNHDMIETDRHLVETKGAMIDLDDDGKSTVHTVSPVPAETN